MYVTVFADGPTRVLRFSDEKNVSSLEQQHVILDLAARLKQVRCARRARWTCWVLASSAGSRGNEPAC